MIELPLTAQSKLLQQDCLKWLKSNPPPEVVGRIEAEEYLEILVVWQKALARDRWIGLNWPEEFGGRGLGLLDEAAIQQCLVKAGSPELVNNFALEIVAPLLLSFGSLEQQKRFLPPILDGEEIWCDALYSAVPKGGNALSATPVEGGFELSGAKRAFGFAPFADYCLTVAGLGAKKQLFALPLQRNLTEVSPVYQFKDETAFYNLVFERAFVPPLSFLGPSDIGAVFFHQFPVTVRSLIGLMFNPMLEQAMSEVASALRQQKGNELLQVEAGKLASEVIAQQSLLLMHLLNNQEELFVEEGATDCLRFRQVLLKSCRAALFSLSKQALPSEGKYAPFGGVSYQRYFRALEISANLRFEDEKRMALAVVLRE